MWRMHGWTGLQVAGLVIVFLVKYFKATSFAFPFVLMLIAVFRLAAVPRLFSPQEIQAVREEASLPPCPARVMTLI